MRSFHTGSLRRYVATTCSIVCSAFGWTAGSAFGRFMRTSNVVAQSPPIASVRET